MARKALVIGGSGFIARYFCETLLERGYAVRSLDIDDKPLIATPADVEFVTGDYLDVCQLEACMRDVDVVYQLAGLLGTTELCASGAAVEAVNVNVAGHVRFLDVCVAMGVKDVFFPTKPNEWTNSYSITKQASERFSEMYSRYHGLRVRLLRWMNFFGPGQKGSPVRKVVPMFVIQALRGLPVEIFGDGKQNVEMMFAEDGARTTVDYVELPWREEFMVPYDAGCGYRMTVNDLATKVVEAAGSKSPIVNMQMRTGETGAWGPLENCWKWTQKAHWRSLDRAIAETVKFYADRPEYVEKVCVCMYGHVGASIATSAHTLQAKRLVETQEPLYVRSLET